MTSNGNTPIFIHSLFRSGSTYLFKVFRRADNRYYCYQEPFNQYLECLNNKADDLLEVDFEMQQSLRHPEITKPYFYEFIQIKESLTGLFNIDFSYEDYFIDLDDQRFKRQWYYIDTLIKKAPAIPVLQFCRTSGRIHALQTSFPGIHIHLWREPRNQWWSYNINGFFMAATQLIYSAKNLPGALNDIRNLVGLKRSPAKDFPGQLSIAYSSLLDARVSYLLFYGLWLYSFINLKKNTDFEINIDELGLNALYRNDKIEQLKIMHVHKIHFDDCSSPCFIFSDKESGFFQDIEKEVQAIFIASGYSHSDIDPATEKSEAIRKLQQECSSSKYFQMDAIKSRKTFISHLDEMSGIVKPIFDQKLSQLEEKQSDRNRELIKSLDSRIKAVNTRLRHEADTARAELNAVHASLSWRITRPLRVLKRLFTRRGRSRPVTAALPSDRLSPAAGRILKELKLAVKKKEQKFK